MMSMASTENTPAGSGNFRNDLLASIVVFLVALPLCIGIAVAVGVSPSRALISGIIGGMIVGFLAGCPLQVSGPAAGLFVIIADFLGDQKADFIAKAQAAADGSEAAVLEAHAMEHALTALGACVMLAGAMQFVAGSLKLGQWFRAVSPAVIEGMLAGIGVLILASQLHVMLDHDPLYDGRKAQGGVEYLSAIPHAVQQTINRALGSDSAAMVGLLTIAVILFWQRFTPARLKLIPAPLAGVLAGTALAQFMQLDVRKLTVAANLLDELTLPTLQTGRLMLDSSIWVSAAVIALIAGAETLLCATAVDKMHTGQRTKYNRELCAQGVGNLLCGLVGALPMTGVIVRSSANVQAGAKTKWSTIMHGTWLLIFVVLFPQVLAYIPKAALGAVLVLTGIRLVKIKTFKEYWQLDKNVVLIFLITMVVIVAKDLLLGVTIGIGLSALKILRRFTRLDIDLQTAPDGRRADLKLRGAATFMRLPLIASALEQVPPGVDLHLELGELTYLDHACLELFTEWSHQHSATGGRLVVDWNSLNACFRREIPGVTNVAVTTKGHVA
jgi:MFS superfamily sulfate permease-like transporter